MSASRSSLFPASRSSNGLSASRSSNGLSSAARSSTALAAAARSSQLLHRVESEFESQLAYNSCPTLFYGVSAFVAGLVVAGTGVAAHQLLLLEISGGALALAGVALVLVRMGLTIDRKLRRVVKWRWFGIQKPSGVHNVSAFDFLTIGQAGRGSKARFEICLSDSNANFQVATFPTESEAHDFANEVGRFLNVRVVDSVSGEWEAVR